jgi:hypothetical protein
VSPSNELVTEWVLIAEETSRGRRFLAFATLAAEWGAKQEREACLKLATEAGRNKAGVAAAIRARGKVKP